MSVDTMDDRQTDTDVIPEPDTTTPSAEALKAKAELYILGLAGRRDGAEFCDAVYLHDEGGWAYRRISPDNSNPWRFMRTADFEKAFYTFSLVDMEAIDSAIKVLIIRGANWRSRFQAAIKAMGPKSRKRLGKRITDDLADH